MGHIQHRNIARGLCLLLIAGATLLVFNDSQSPGFCPNYPVLGVPACYIVLIYFSIVAATLYAAPTQKTQILFFAVGALAIATGLYFSTLEITTPGPQCPSACRGKPKHNKAPHRHRAFMIAPRPGKLIN